MAKYICNGAKCKCTLSDSEGTLMVNSQNKIFIQNKLMATENEKTFLPNFVSCKKTNPPTPCMPNILEPWSSTKGDVFQTQNKGLLEDSECKCEVGGKISIIDSKQSATKNVIFGDYSSEPTEISNVYVKIRTLEDYKGEFGFDWLDIHPETMEIEKIQGIPFENVEYFYKKGNTPADLGNIVAVSSDTDKQDAKQAIKENYGFTNFYNHVDIPFVLLQPNPDPEVFIKLSLEVFFKGTPQDDYISITGDDYYEFEIVGGEKDKKTTRKKITSNEKLLLKVKCLKESSDIKYAFVHTGARGPREVGGLNMMENKVLELKFRVIALVSNEGNPSEKAKTLFKKFKDSEITKYLNENSLNQAGYKVVIENQEMFTNLDNPSVNLDNYLYAFDKKDWESKSYYKLEDDTEMLFYDIDVDSGKKNEKGEPIIITKHIDYLTIEEYHKKSKYNGGLIILGDGKSMNPDAGAFSRREPLNHYAIFVYSNNTGSKDTYSHEIGHMLGLKHTFFKDNDIEDFEKYKTYITKLITDRTEIQNENFSYYTIKETITNKKLIINALNNYNQSIRKDINRREAKYKKDEKSNGNFLISITEIVDGKHRIVTKSVSKQEYLKISRATIDKFKTEEANNISAIEEFQHKKDIYTTFERENGFSLFKEDYISILNDYENYYIEFVSANYIAYKEKTTQNIMDYSPSINRIRFLNHQIKIMRKDYENY